MLDILWEEMEMGGEKGGLQIVAHRNVLTTTVCAQFVMAIPISSFL